MPTPPVNHYYSTFIRREELSRTTRTVPANQWDEKRQDRFNMYDGRSLLATNSSVADILQKLVYYLEQISWKSCFCVWGMQA